MAKLVTNTDSVAHKERAEFEILPTQENSPTDFTIDGRRIRMGRNGMTKTSDAGLAREIDARYGAEGTKEIVVVPVTKRIDPDHKRTFLVSLPPKLQENLRKARND